MKMSKEEFLSLSGIEHQTLGVWIAQEWLKPSGSSVEPSFTDIDIARARLIRELFVDFGVNTEGVGVILNLVDQLSWRAQVAHGIASSGSHYTRRIGLRLPNSCVCYSHFITADYANPRRKKSALGVRAPGHGPSDAEYRDCQRVLVRESVTALTCE